MTGLPSVQKELKSLRPFSGSGISGVNFGSTETLPSPSTKQMTVPYTSYWPANSSTFPSGISRLPSFLVAVA